MGNEGWLDYIFNRPDQIHKTIVEKDGKEYIFTISTQEFEFEGEKLKTTSFSDVTELERIKTKFESIYNDLKSSIEYASLIQNSVVPEEKLFNRCFRDHFVLWHQKDIVGGDIYLFEELRHEEEFLMMVIDCTGHGVPGAFVTMLVKAIEREIVAKISKSQFDVSPAIILQHFNRTMKKLLKQETNDTLSNSGFDGGIVYINKKEGFIRFAGAQTSLFCVQESQLSTIKGERQSIGYKKSNPDFTFTDHQIELNDSSCFYLATDGFLDQTGGKKGLVFGKRRFLDMIRNNYQKPFSQQQQIFMESLAAYQGTHARKDDITVVGFRL
jgi:serine phosphatase RsbU (regulator of sigma subunit)